mmetsp:Transcript_139006/g.443511  ORF Transcript_139006/g.443511 Transcript_139006/m.443511 type:complete len:217 (+) Transcript_139006:2072-2722(+)
MTVSPCTSPSATLRTVFIICESLMVWNIGFRLQVSMANMCRGHASTAVHPQRMIDACLCSQSCRWVGRRACTLLSARTNRLAFRQDSLPAKELLTVRVLGQPVSLASSMRLVLTISSSLDSSSVWFSNMHKHMPTILLHMASLYMRFKMAKTQMDFVGLHFDGERHEVRLGWSRLRKLRLAIDFVLEFRFMNGHQSEKLTGHITWTLLLRRETLSI